MEASVLNFWKVFEQNKRFYFSFETEEMSIFSDFTIFVACRPRVEVHIYFSSCQFETRSFRADTCVLSRHIIIEYSAGTKGADSDGN